ncbi:MAG: AmmeMemoRadiSam system protein B [Phycisphaerales bacterium]|nr:AmmeMemoRadiSam system protein B [Phycisphaerales bacterium]
MSQMPPSPPPFDAAAPHHERPRLRPVRGFPVQQNGQTLLGLSDARQISDRVVFTLPQAQAILPHMNGETSVDEIVAKVGKGLTRQMLEGLVAQLDDAGLLEGPRFESLLAEMRSEYDSAPFLPPASTAHFAEALVADFIARDLQGGNPEASVTQQQVQEKMAALSEDEKAERGRAHLDEILGQWMDHVLEKAERPSFDALPRAIVAPHLDYPRGWMNYAHVYGRMRVVDRPDRIVILGTNHFGLATGVCGCDKGFASPLGVCELDGDFLDMLKSELGPEHAGTYLANRYDHEREHSIELHLPWIQKVFGQDQAGNYPKVVAALVHDPVANNGASYDGKGLDIQPFIDALKATIAKAPGRTLVIASADLSHVGRSFGDQRAIVGEDPDAAAFRNEIVQHDQEMLQLIGEGKAEELVASMAWMQNRTRWCSIGNLFAMMKVVGAEKVEVLNYVAAADQQGVAMVTSCAAAVS